MANPASLTVNEVSANAAITQPAAQAIDTNGIVNCQIDSKGDHLMIELINLDDTALTVTIKGGTGVQAHTARDLAIALAATGAAGDKKIVGPLESARFVKADGSIDVQFAGGASPTSTIRVYRLAKQ
jgi:hypothetical protein